MSYVDERRPPEYHQSIVGDLALALLEAGGLEIVDDLLELKLKPSPLAIVEGFRAIVAGGGHHQSSSDHQIRAMSIR